MEGLALTGASVDRERGPAVDHRAGDGRLVRSLRAAEAGRAGDPDGPDRRTRPRRRAGETVLLVGGGLGNAVLFSIGQALRANGSRVIYFAGYKKMHRPLQGRGDRARRRRHRLVLRRGAGLPRRRAPQDSAFVGNIVDGDRRLRLGRARRARRSRSARSTA